MKGDKIRVEVFLSISLLFECLRFLFQKKRGENKKVVMSRFSKDSVCLYNNLSKEILLCIFYYSSRYANACAVNMHS